MCRGQPNGLAVKHVVRPASVWPGMAGPPQFRRAAAAAYAGGLAGLDMAIAVPSNKGEVAGALHRGAGTGAIFGSRPTGACCADAVQP